MCSQRLRQCRQAVPESPIRQSGCPNSNTQAAGWTESQHAAVLSDWPADHPYLEAAPRRPDESLHTRRKTAAAALAWLGSVASQRLLTLRDPRAIDDERRARPCNVSVGPGVVLRCAGHAPTRRSVLPPLGAMDACALPMCGAGGLRGPRAWAVSGAVIRTRVARMERAAAVKRSAATEASSI